LFDSADELDPEADETPAASAAGPVATSGPRVADGLRRQRMVIFIFWVPMVTVMLSISQRPSSSFRAYWRSPPM
jgi:hypothetical protein